MRDIYDLGPFYGQLGQIVRDALPQVYVRTL